MTFLESHSDLPGANVLNDAHLSVILDTLWMVYGLHAHLTNCNFLALHSQATPPHICKHMAVSDIFFDKNANFQIK